MNRTNFFNGMEVSAEDLQYSQEALTHQIKKSRTDIAGKGVLSAVSDYVQLDPSTLQNGTPTIRVLPFSAYNHLGERIETSLVFGLALDLTDPTNRQLGEQGTLSLSDFGWEDGATYQICVKYIERGARPLPQDGSAVPYASRIYSGFQYYALRKGIDSLIENGVNPYIILAEATYNVISGVKTLQITNLGITEYCSIDGGRVGITPSNKATSIYDPQNSSNVLNPQTISFDDHIHAIGDVNAVSASNPHGITAAVLGLDTQSVPTHEKLYHSDGLLAGSNGINTTSSGFYMSVTPRVSLVDFLKVYNLASDELLHYNGTSIRYFINSTIPSVFLSLSDNNGIWASGTYYLYISTANNSLFISVPDNSAMVNRTYSIYNTITNSLISTTSPVPFSSIDVQKHYLLYSFVFSDVKGASTLYNTSNFLSAQDYRTFGSISSDNLQRDANGAFNLPYTLKVSDIQFSLDNSTLNSSIGILESNNISNCILSAPAGVFEIGSGSSANKVIIKSGLTLLCANGRNSVGTCNNITTTYKVNTTSTSTAPTNAGTYYVFAGVSNDETNQAVYFSDNYIISSTMPVNPTGNNPFWFNTVANEIKSYLGGSWSAPLQLAKLGKLTVSGGNVVSIVPDSAILLLSYDDLRTYMDGYKSTVMNWFHLKYSAKITCTPATSGTMYTAPKDGIIVWNMQIRYGGGDKPIYLSIGDVIHRFVNGDTGNMWGCSMSFPIAKNQIAGFWWPNGVVNAYNEAYFIPFEGAD